MILGAHTVRLDFHSTFEMLDVVQAVSEHLGRLAGLDDDALHWVTVAVRESVINAIRHGNAGDEQKQVHVDFTPLDASAPRGIAIRVRDEGPGFDPDTVPAASIGLAGLRDRVESLGDTMVVRSSSKGTRLTMSIGTKDIEPI